MKNAAPTRGTAVNRGNGDPEAVNSRTIQTITAQKNCLEQTQGQGLINRHNSADP